MMSLHYIMLYYDIIALHYDAIISGIYDVIVLHYDYDIVTLLMTSLHYDAITLHYDIT